MAEIDRVIKCIGRRRLVVTLTGENTTLNLWYNDPPLGKQIAALQLPPLERDKLLAALTELKANV